MFHGSSLFLCSKTSRTALMGVALSRGFTKHEGRQRQTRGCTHIEADLSAVWVTVMLQTPPQEAGSLRGFSAESRPTRHEFSASSHLYKRCPCGRCSPWNLRRRPPPLQKGPVPGLHLNQVDSPGFRWPKNEVVTSGANVLWSCYLSWTSARKRADQKALRRRTGWRS